MECVRRSLAVFLAALVVAPSAQAQTHVIPRSALAQAIQERVSQDQADREAIASLLQRAEARPGETVLVHGASGGVGTAAV